MFCPLCKSEYRDGFTRCTDCETPLTFEGEARAAVVTSLWHGYNARKYNALIAALREAGVPCHGQQVGDPDTFTPLLGLLGNFRAVSRLFKGMKWKVEVLAEDHPRAVEIKSEVLAD